MCYQFFTSTWSILSNGSSDVFTLGVDTWPMADGRRMSFRTLNDRNRQRAFKPFLSAANHIHGVAISLAIHKSIRELCTDDRLFRYCMSECRV
jgi:hypothetical protein